MYHFWESQALRVGWPLFSTSTKHINTFYPYVPSEESSYPVECLTPIPVVHMEFDPELEPTGE